jgi:hypothetical protein
MRAWRRIAVPILALSLPLLSCDGEIKGSATFFGKVAVPLQASQDDLKFETITVSGKSSTDACPNGAVFTERFTGAYAAVKTGGAFASPQLTFPDSFKHTSPPSCGPVDLHMRNPNIVSSFDVVATLPPNARNCAAFCEAQCKVKGDCAANCAPRCLTAHAIVGHGGKPQFKVIDRGEDPLTSVRIAIVFDTLRS